MSPPGYSPLERVRDPGYTGFPADRFDIERLSEELTRYKQALERIGKHLRDCSICQRTPMLCSAFNVQLAVDAALYPEHWEDARHVAADCELLPPPKEEVERG